MPDISKLEQLCNVLHITIYALLGSDNKQAETVSQILKDGQMPPVEDVAEIAPIVPPKKIRQAVDETTKKRKINLKAIGEMAPFLDQEALETLLSECEEEGLSELLSELAPFVSKQMLGRLIQQYLEAGTLQQIIGEVVPFLDRQTIDTILCQCSEEDEALLSELVPFASREALDKLVEQRLESGNTAGLSEFYPFLGKQAMHKLVKKMMETGDFDSMQDAAVFL